MITWIFLFSVCVMFLIRPWVNRGSFASSDVNLWSTSWLTTSDINFGGGRVRPGVDRVHIFLRSTRQSSRTTQLIYVTITWLLEGGCAVVSRRSLQSSVNKKPLEARPPVAEWPKGCWHNRLGRSGWSRSGQSVLLTINGAWVKYVAGGRSTDTDFFVARWRWWQWKIVSVNSCK